MRLIATTGTILVGRLLQTPSLIVFQRSRPAIIAAECTLVTENSIAVNQPGRQLRSLNCST